MKRWRGFAIVCLALLVGCTRACAPTTEPRGSTPHPPPSPAYAYDEEFAGPFPSWKSVRDFGAHGDGVSDDTAAIQRALDALRTVRTNSWSVLFFPAGNYRLTRTLVTRRVAHEDYLGASIVGEDPDTTKLTWDGDADRDMFHYDAWYGKVSRLTFDGKQKARVGLYRGDSFSTYFELSDLAFVDMETGIRFGGGLETGKSAGQAEQAVLRCRFSRCSKHGILTSDWNSLDVWVWYSRFEDCEYGLFNMVGNFHAWKNVFIRSRSGDVGSQNLHQFSFVENTSVGSGTFMNWSSMHTWGAQVLALRNQIYDARDYPLVTGSAGPFILIDNVVRSRPENRAGFLLTANDQVLIGNTLTTGVEREGMELAPHAQRGATRTRKFDNKIVDRATLALPNLTLPPTPPARQRPVYEVAPGASADIIQSQIDAAAREPVGTRAIVHLPKGRFALAKTLRLPKGADLQLVGDGASEAGSLLVWAGEGSGPMLRIDGPSRATLRDLALAGQSDGIVATGVDQSGGRVYADQINIKAAGDSSLAPEYGLLVDGVEQADVTVSSISMSGTKNNVLVRGGPRRKAGKDTEGQVSILTGASSSAGILYDVADGGGLLAAAVWYEGVWPDPTHINLHSSGDLTLAGLLLAAPPDSHGPLVRVHQHSGTFALIASGILGSLENPIHRLEIDGNTPRMKVLSLGNAFFNPSQRAEKVDSMWIDKSRSPSQAAFIQNHEYGQFAQRMLLLPERFEHRADKPADDEFVRSSLGQLRALRVEPVYARPAGVTDLRFHRVMVTAGVRRTAISLGR